MKISSYRADEIEEGYGIRNQAIESQHDVGGTQRGHGFISDRSPRYCLTMY